MARPVFEDVVPVVPLSSLEAALERHRQADAGGTLHRVGSRLQVH